MGSKRFYIKKGKLWKLTSNNVYKMVSPHKQGACDDFYVVGSEPRDFFHSSVRINREKFYNLLEEQFSDYTDFWEFKGEYYCNGPRFSGDFEDKCKAYYALPMHVTNQPRTFRVVYYLGKPYYSTLEYEEFCMLYDINNPDEYQGYVLIDKCSPVYKLY